VNVESPVSVVARHKAGGRAAVFLDRDGVLNEFVLDTTSGLDESPMRPEDVSLIAGAPAAAARLAGAGFALICVTNQPAAAKGRASIEQLHAVHAEVLGLLAREHVWVDASRLCPHHPEGVVPEFAGPCICRKPAAGMLLDAAAEFGIDLGASWMVGDSDVDIAAGRAAGCRTVLLDYPKSARKRTGSARPDLRADDLADAVERLPMLCEAS
jgi:D-glycero-D-manno-heptose 1,7-bisphosphate phosphatase